MERLFGITICLFAIVGIITTFNVIGKIAWWFIKHKKAIEGYARLQKEMQTKKQVQ